MSYRVIAYILLCGLFLQSCSSFSNPVNLHVPRKQKELPSIVDGREGQEISHLLPVLSTEEHITPTNNPTDTPKDASLYLDKVGGKVGAINTRNPQFTSPSASSKLSLYNKKGPILSHAIRHKSEQHHPHKTSDEEEQKTPIQQEYISASQEKTFIAKGDYQVKFKQNTDGKWQAKVLEKIGGLSREHVLPVCFEPALTPEKITKNTPIHAILPKGSKPGYVCVGSMGLKGGMMRSKELEHDYDAIPNECFCPITQKIMEDPVMAQDGYTYERSAIQAWFDKGKRMSPKTGARLLSTELIPNHSMRDLIQDFKQQMPILASHQLQLERRNIEAAMRLGEEALQEKLAKKEAILERKEKKRKAIELEAEPEEGQRKKQKIAHPAQIQKLTDKRELRIYFSKGMLKVTPKNYQILLEHSRNLEELFQAYDKGVIVSAWPVSLGMEKLVELLIAFSKVTNFNVDINWDQSGREVETAVGEAIARSVQFYEQLTSLNLSGCRLNDESWQDILASIPYPDKMRELDIRGNQLSEEAIERSRIHFANLVSLEQDEKPAIQGERSVIKELKKYFHDGKLGITPDNYQVLLDQSLSLEAAFYAYDKGILVKGWPVSLGMERLVELLTAFSNITSFEIDINWDRSDKAVEKIVGESIARSIQFYEQLTSLSLLGCRLDIKSLQDIIESIPCPDKLKELNIRGNQLSEEAIERIRTHFPNLARLEQDEKPAIEEKSTMVGGPMIEIEREERPITEEPSVGGETPVILDAGQCYMLGEKYRKGEEVAQDYQEASKWYQKAMEADDIYRTKIEKLLSSRDFWPWLKDIQIHTLYLQNNRIDAEGAKVLAATLPGTQVHTLYLKDNNIGAEGAIALAKALPKTQAHTIDLDNNSISARGAIALTKALPHTKVHTLTLSSNNIGTAGVTALAAALPKSHIHNLILENNKIDAEGAASLAGSLPHTQVNNLGLKGNIIGTKGTIALAKALPNTKVHTLTLSSNNIGTAGIIALAKALPDTKVHTMGLSSNRIGAKGAVALAEILPNTELHTLTLSSNGIGIEGSTALAKALPNAKVHTLYLNSNNIEDDGVAALAEALPNTQLHTLYLARNHIGSKGTAALAKALPNTQVYTLDLGGNNIGDEEALALAAVLPYTQVYTIYLGDTQISDTIKKSLKEKYIAIKWYF